jgi:hypothetical protein
MHPSFPDFLRQKSPLHDRLPCFLSIGRRKEIGKGKIEHTSGAFSLTAMV